MVKLRNCSPSEFKRRVKNNRVFIYGAGRALESSFDIYFKEADVIAVIDKNEKLWGKTIGDRFDSPKVESPAYLKEYLSKYGVNDVLLFVATTFYAAEIVEELDRIDVCEGLNCYIHLLIRNTKENEGLVDFSEGAYLIPKKLHYIWLGNNEMPDSYVKNIEGWISMHPDFELIRWTEEDFRSEQNVYMREALGLERYAFASNYMRLKIIYEHGGIYLDTDVELIRRLDPLMHDECFFCMGTTDSINNGCGFGAVPYHPLIKKMLSQYEGIHFDCAKKGVGQRTGHAFLHMPLEEAGFVIQDSYQRINGVVLYPKEVMSPLTFDDSRDFFTENTLSIHHEAGSWKKAHEKEGVEKLKLMVRERIIDWT